MHASVKDVWVTFNEPLEGKLRTPYADIKGLVTIGMGNMYDATDQHGIPLPPDDAWALVGREFMALPFKNAAGALVPKSQVKAAWFALARDLQASRLGWRYAASLPAVGSMALDDADVDAIIDAKLAQHDAIISPRFADWEDRPADAQLAVHSMAWGMGPYFWRKFPKFSAAFSDGDYTRAALECSIMPEVGTIRLRNQRNKILFTNASQVAADPNADRSVLIWA